VLHTGQSLHVVDLTDEQKNPPVNDPPEHRIVFDRDRQCNVVARRNPKWIDGIVIHQTSCHFGVSAKQVKESGGNAMLAKHRRALNVAAHMTAMDTGYAVLAHPLDWYVYHANSLCARSIGLEVEGVFPGMMGKSKPLLTPALEQAARDGLAYILEKSREQGMTIKYIWAHRQSSPIKENDPGEEIWKRIVLAYAVPMLGLQVQSDFVSGGKPIPETWKLPTRKPVA
jgi:hypothetical protein